MNSASRIPAAQLSNRLISFMRFARSHGLAAGLAETRDGLAVAADGTVTDRASFYWATKSLLCQKRDDWQKFEELFERFWSVDDGPPIFDVVQPRAEAIRNPLPLGEELSDQPPQARQKRAFGGFGGSTSQQTGAGAGDYELLSKADFRFLKNQSQRLEAERHVALIASKIRKRLLRKWGHAPSGSRLDMRRTMRGALASGGWPIDLSFRRRKRGLPRIVFLLDISQSMEAYSRMYLRLAWAFASRFDDVATFAFHVRLLDLRRVFRQRNIDRVVDNLTAFSTIWLGGTRIGDSLVEFNAIYGRNVINSRTIVVIVSDGCDSTSGNSLPIEVEKLQRRARSVLWLNPLLGRDIGPVAETVPPMERGLHAAQPYMDYYGPGHTLQALNEMADFLAAT
jgi:uncharacterized protein with von Willebrand factor type A (vWA) domain